MADSNLSISDDFQRDLSDISVELERIDDLAAGVGRTLSASLRSAIIDGKSFKSVLGDIADSFANIALKAAFKPVENLAAGFIESLFGSAGSSLAGVTGFAKGGVLASPSYFPLGQGLGVAGEAGPEAVLPLTRGSDGRLGVASNASSPISISFNVNASDARSFVGAEAEVSAMLLRAVRRGTRAS
jgi:phage-related minor tail protein